MKLREHISDMRAAHDCDLLEGSFQAAIKAYPMYGGRTWARIHRVMRERALELCQTHPAGFLVPRIGTRRRMVVCGSTYAVGYGQNGAGERYTWEYAKNFAVQALVEEGVAAPDADLVWEWANTYPHRALQIAIKTRT